MARKRNQHGYLYRRGKSWRGQFRIDTTELDEHGKFKRKALDKFIAPAEGPGKVGYRRADKLFYEMYLKDLDKSGPLSTRTVSQFVSEIFNPQVVLRCKPTGKAHYEEMLKNHVLPALGDFMMRDVLPGHIYNLLNAKLDTGLSIQTVVHIRNTISSVFRHAKRVRAYSGDLPTDGVKLPPLVHAERQALTWNQVLAVAAHLPEQLSSLVLILALTGLRIGEAMGLRWKHVDLETGTLHVRENFVRGKYGTLKTARSRRDVPLHSIAIAELLKLKQFYAGGSAAQEARHFREVEAAGANPARQLNPDSPVFAGAKSGLPLDQHNIAKRFLKGAGKRAGVPWVSWHCLRHTFATLADQIGMSIAERQRVMGHASGAMNLHYTHADINLTRERMEKIGKVN